MIPIRISFFIPMTISSLTPVAGQIFGPLSTRLRWVWVFLERTRILSGIQFTTHFIEFFVAETKRFVGSFVHVILTRQTCCQRSSKVAESKRRALGNYFSERICYMFRISKCRRDRDVGLCTTSVLAFGKPMRSGDFRGKNVFCRRKNRILLFDQKKLVEINRRCGFVTKKNGSTTFCREVQKKDH